MVNLNKLREIYSRWGMKGGGVKMIDLDNFINSLKICWIKRMIEADNDTILNKNIYTNNLSSFGGNFLLECNISEDNILK